MAEIRNLDKAAILLYVLSPEAAETVRHLLGEDDASGLLDLMRFYSQQPNLDELIEQVLREFIEATDGRFLVPPSLLGGDDEQRAAMYQVQLEIYHRLRGGAPTAGTYDRTSSADRWGMMADMLAGDEGRQHALDDLEVGDDPIRALQLLDVDVLASVLRKERPPAIAVVLNNLDPVRAAQVLGRMNPRDRCDIFAQMGAGAPDDVELNRRVVRTIVELCVGMGPDARQHTEEHHKRQLVEVIQGIDRDDRDPMLQELRKRDPQLADDVEAGIVTFEHLLKIDDRLLQQFLADRRLNLKVLAIALADVPTELEEPVRQSIEERVRHNMGEGRRHELDEEIRYRHSVTREQVREARQQITRRLREHDRRDQGPL